MKGVAFPFLLLLALAAPAAGSQPWYLLVPPRVGAGVDATAPLAQWEILDALDSQTTCSELRDGIRSVVNDLETKIREIKQTQKAWFDSNRSRLDAAVKKLTGPPAEGKVPLEELLAPLTTLIAKWQEALAAVQTLARDALPRAPERLGGPLRRLYTYQAAAMVRAEDERERADRARCLPSEALPPGMLPLK